MARTTHEFLMGFHNFFMYWSPYIDTKQCKPDGNSFFSGRYCYYRCFTLFYCFSFHFIFSAFPRENALLATLYRSSVSVTITLARVGWDQNFFFFGKFSKDSENVQFTGLWLSHTISSVGQQGERSGMR